MRPNFLMVSEPGSFAEHTIRIRKPGIIAQVIASHHYPAEITAALQALRSELSGGPVAPLAEDTPDREDWQQALAPWKGKTWLELPWFLAETYFYRRLLEAVRYFEPGAFFLLDPFEPQKRQALEEGLAITRRFYENPLPHEAEKRFYLAMARSLWGNRADLSNIVITANSETQGEETHHLLIDHRRRVWDLFASGRVKRLDIVTDNSGPELLADLGLLGFLFEHGLIESAHLHLKPQPFFVSDAMPKDYALTRQALQCIKHAPSRALGDLLHQAEKEGCLHIETHPFWASSHHFTELPPDLYACLAQSDLILLKGDVNYRRLLEDRHWPPTTDLAAVTRYMPAPYVTLRTLKAELIVGLQEGQAEALAAQDPSWLVNGKRGVIHYVNPRA